MPRCSKVAAAQLSSKARHQVTAEQQQSMVSEHRSSSKARYQSNRAAANQDIRSPERSSKHQQQGKTFAVDLFCTLRQCTAFGPLHIQHVGREQSQV
eukprot:29532-Chlamydomonas_euryale.AAC.1